MPCPILSNILLLPTVNEVHFVLQVFPSSGKVSIAASCQWIEPTTDSEEEEEAAERARQMHVSACWVWNPVCHMKGRYSEMAKNSIWRGIFGHRREEIK
jgi:hypothetical protein